MFGEFRVRIDPWDVEYGAETPLEPGDETEATVDLSVEREPAEWTAVRPEAVADVPPRIVFVDGVRRLETRLHVWAPGDEFLHGAFGSFAVGAAVIEQRTAKIERPRPERIIAFGGNRLLGSPVCIHSSLEYLPYTTEENEPDSPLRRVQRAMRSSEAMLAQRFCDPKSMVIVDGPLTFDTGVEHLAFGYVKRIHRTYLSPELLPLLRSLPPATRTPVFAVHKKSSGHRRHTWFQRLCEPSPGGSDLHGLVRVETREKGIEETSRWADTLTAMLPRYSPSPVRDPRAPQNLLPIGALEARLRADLGDARLIRRWIQHVIATETTR
jgi:hypothetical protein